jgi:hypothetical protein
VNQGLGEMRLNEICEQFLIGEYAAERGGVIIRFVHDLYTLPESAAVSFLRAATTACLEGVVFDYDESTYRRVKQAVAGIHHAIDAEAYRDFCRMEEDDLKRAYGRRVESRRAKPRRRRVDRAAR